MNIIDCEQGSSAWYAARRGLVTASEVGALITPLWKQRTGEGVETFLYKKLCERALGWSSDELNGGTWAMEQGQIIERIALPWYAFTFDCEPRRVGFCAHDTLPIGCSPDALVGDTEGLEIKSPQPPVALKYLLRNEVPAEYLPQIHFSLLVTGFRAWTFVSFSRQFPPLVIRVERDEKIIAAIQSALDAFLATFDEKLARIPTLKEADARGRGNLP